MVNGHGPNVPILGQQPTKAPVSLAAFPRHIDDAGLVDLSDGHVPRKGFVDATELVEMIRVVVREEIKAALKEHKP